MEIEEEIKEMEDDKCIDRLPSVEIGDDSYRSNYEQIDKYQGYFGNAIDIKEDYKKYLDKRYKNEIVSPMPRAKYQQYVNILHEQFIDNYVQPLWENLLNKNLAKVNEIKKNMQTFLQK